VRKEIGRKERRVKNEEKIEETCMSSNQSGLNVVTS
jgi:hypothetical protein